MIFKNIMLVIAIFAITSCDDRKDYVFDSLVKPNIGFSKTKTETGESFISDSVKLNFTTYSIYYVSNESKVIKPTISINYDISALEITQNENLKSLSIKPLKQGSFAIEIIETDLYNNSSTAKLYLTVFENLLPIVICEYSVKNDNRVDINLEKSYDKDQRFGGKITEYKFKIRSNYEFNSPTSKAEIQFPSKGVFPVTFWVKDNNNVWSEPLNTFIYL